MMCVCEVSFNEVVGFRIWVLLFGIEMLGYCAAVEALRGKYIRDKRN